MHVWTYHGGWRFLPCLWFSFVLSLWTLLLTLDPWIALPTSFWHTTALPLHKCFMEHMQCSRYGFGIRDIRWTDQAQVLSSWRNSLILRQSKFNSAPPSHMILCHPPSPHCCVISRIDSHGREDLHTTTLTWSDAVPDNFLYKDFLPQIFTCSLLLYSYLIIHGGKK